MTSKGWKRGLVTAGALLLGLAVATSSWAQGMFYKEIKKDDRFYVFNDAKKADAFEKSGETGTGLTRMGAGPNGETVFADSETALELFFFKYGISQVVERPKSPTQRIVWQDGKTRITTDNAYLEISNRLQLRYTHELPDDSIQLPGTETKGDSKGSFRIRRAKLKSEGWIFNQYITYEVQLNWPAATGSNIGAFLEDAYVGWDPTKKGTFKVMIGQNKVPFGHQEMTSSGSQLFVDRAEVSNTYARGRDTGLTVIGVLGGNKLEYRAGVYNGNGLTRTLNDNAKFQYNARLMWQVAGNQPLKQRAWVSGVYYSEGDFESTDKPLFALGANFEKNDFHLATTAIDLKDTIYGFDGTFKFKGVFLTAEYYLRERTPEPPAPGAAAAKFDSDGWFAQAAYNFGPGRKWALAGRYGSWDPSSLLSVNERTEWRVGLSYFYSRHTLKVQADFGELKTEAAAGDIKNQEFRLQTQIIF
jgi:phosphate-selective porin OprO/OprP